MSCEVLEAELIEDEKELKKVGYILQSLLTDTHLYSHNSVKRCGTALFAFCRM